VQGLHTAVLLFFPFRSCAGDPFSSPTCEVVTDRCRAMRKARRCTNVIPRVRFIFSPFLETAALPCEERRIARAFKKGAPRFSAQPDRFATANAWIADKTGENSPERIGQSRACCRQTDERADTCNVCETPHATDPRRAFQLVERRADRYVSV
jgi:hypothetical protein